MIQLELEDYCQECPDFEAEIRKIKYESSFGYEVCDTTVCCENAVRCAVIKKYIKRMNKQKED